jgi:hypothetical protein
LVFPNVASCARNIVKEDVLATLEGDRRLKSRRDAAVYLGVSVGTLDQLLALRVLVPVRIPNVERTFVDVRDLDDLIERAKAPA